MRMRLTCLALLVGCGLASAETVPRASGLDPRVRVTQFVDGQVYRVNVSVLKVTTFEFGQDEEIRSIVAGDTEGFDFDAVPGGRVMVVKPKVSGIGTNITVYTTKRSYYFQVQEAGARAGYYVIRFKHPEDRQVPANKAVVQREPYDGYGADRLTAITPFRVFDDGTFTYFYFRRNNEVPAIFRAGQGRERTTNSNVMPDGAVRVSGVSHYWLLRAGDVENTIAREIKP